MHLLFRKMSFKDTMTDLKFWMSTLIVSIVVSMIVKLVG